MDSYQKSYRLVKKSPMSLSLRIRLPHGHNWTFKEVDAFVDSQLKGGEPVPSLAEMKIVGDVASARFHSKVPVVKTEFNYTTDSGPWQKREWKTIDASREVESIISVCVPKERPLVCFLSLIDERDVTITIPYVELK